MTEPPDFAHTSYARDARVRKATRIEAALRMAGVDATGARALDDKERRAVEKTAGVRKSSEETWEAAFTLMDAFRPTSTPDGIWGADSRVQVERAQLWHGHPCPVDGMEQGDPDVCHHCESVIAGWSPWQDARAPGVRFCSEVCSLAHLVGQT